MTRLRLWLAVAACVLPAGMAVNAAYGQTSDELISCSVQGEVGQKDLLCNIRIAQPSNIVGVDLSVGDQQIDDGKLEVYDSAAAPSAYLFLIDRSNPRRAGTVARNLAFARSVQNRAETGQQIGIATFASDVRVLLGIGERNVDIDSAIAAVKADGAATEFFSSAIEGVRLLADADAERKALIIMSDGKAEDTAYEMEDLVSHAKEAGIVIYGMGFAESAVDMPSLQVLRRAAEETDGPFTSAVGSGDIDSDFTADFFRYLESGGQLTASLPALYGDAAITLTLDLDSGSSITHTQTVNLGPEPQPEPEPEPEPVVIPEPTGVAALYAYLDGVWPDASKWAAENTYLAILLLIIPVLLIALIAYLLLSRRSEADDDEMGDGTQVIGLEDGDGSTDDDILPLGAEASSPLGWFQMVDNHEDRFPITSHSLQIGRHTDSDFKLNNDSVHRRHAHFQFDTDMNAIITDLDTVNGVRVNGEKIMRAQLKDGDLIQLGEVRFTYVAA